MTNKIYLNNWLNPVNRATNRSWEKVNRPTNSFSLVNLINASLNLISKGLRMARGLLIHIEWITNSARKGSWSRMSLKQLLWMDNRRWSPRRPRLLLLEARCRSQLSSIRSQLIIKSELGLARRLKLIRISCLIRIAWLSPWLLVNYFRKVRASLSYKTYKCEAQEAPFWQKRSCSQENIRPSWRSERTGSHAGVA